MAPFARPVASGSRTEVLPSSGSIQVQSAGKYIIPSESPEMNMLKLLGKAREVAKFLTGPKKEELLQRIEEWEALFSETPIDPSVQEKWLQMAYRMCYVHWNVEQVMIACGQQDPMRGVWETLAGEVKQQLSEILPEDIHADTFRASIELQLLAHKAKLVAERFFPEKRQMAIEMIEGWEVQFFQTMPLGPTNGEECIDAAYLICFLQRNLEIAMLQFAQNEEDQLACDALCVGLSNRLSDVLPKGCSAEAFRAIYEERVVEQGMLELLPVIEELRQRLYANVEQLSQQLSTCFEEVKAEMKETHEESQLSQERLHKKVGAAIATVNQLYQDFGKRMEECKVVEQRLPTITTTINQNVNNLQNALRRL